MVSNRIIRECVVLLAMWRQRWAALGTGSLTEGQAKGLSYLFPIQKSGTVSQAMSQQKVKLGRWPKFWDQAQFPTPCLLFTGISCLETVRPLTWEVTH